MGSRLNFIDVARAFAIALALFSHAMITFGGWSHYDIAWARAFTRMATPLFVFMFGMMLELAYVRKAARGGLADIRGRLFARAKDCYVWYLLTIVSAIVGGYIAFGEALGPVVFLGSVHYGDILQFYAVALAVAPALVWLRLRLGPGVLVALLAAIWLLDGVWLDGLADTSFGPLTPWVGIVLGAGSYHVGPSVLHGFTFVLAGMLVGAGLQGWRERGLRRFYGYAFGMLAVAVAAAAVVAVLPGPDGVPRGAVGVLKGFVDYSVFRADNHLGYYAAGLALCLGTLLVLSWTVPRSALPAWSAVPLQFGQSSLLSYALGDILLNVMAPLVQPAIAAWAPVLAVLFVVAMLGLVNGWAWVSAQRVANTHSGRTPGAEAALTPRSAA